ncbi:SDR family NAD(P)-dependent oxidoreductase [Neomegalonema sp.]|uniref:SDR family NAD(P)-dependent oxidoreductase n=1 Tax=Neomegalonema sp. TaxID=2039713 RepID=UPI0026146DA9|nr:SDR family oxidoreductase [Neomegalonema sp.]MDD2867575.1 SDR family NAD(P)-dependent oxidoreductase [Neomegalonema sp.]
MEIADFPEFPGLAGASVMVTGGGSGIGAALTEAFLRQGAKTAFVQRSDASAFCEEMERRTGARPLHIPCDLTDVEALRAAFARAAEAHGPIGILVNNAADDDRHKTLDVTEAYWDANQAINLKSCFFAAQAVLPGMRAAGGGVIVNFSSLSYLMGLEGFPSYTASKAAIVALTRSLAREFGPEGIRVNALVPGWVLTEKQKRLWVTPEGLAAHVARQCLKETLAPADVAGPTLFLASGLSRMMTGQALVIDGGVATTG